mmetsp:Transcript_50656/g.99048  ORF Transcript_50656/g.99048 Transcript_50656/m.99048 type:complete len:191 (+) Transcript_50656:177-749(+)|eukprot:CAMPEP_0194331932 /NCGR_PEP_ID=MMETSP0171-20130528/57396_1 /TAXON_ID=218684 /ORGANISM="Corethron pennatum, Strain L29A3" /LENGTH=190 /DNA_ID=CAMNT_0039093603 /DNA_START=159 /DNA_END=731 /DNA_ORIENTATION=+
MVAEGKSAFFSAFIFFLLLPPSCLALIKIRPAVVPADLPAIKECRLTAFPDPNKILEAGRSFVNCEKLMRGDGRHVCVVATEGGRGGPIVGTADVDVGPAVPVVGNVFVREDRRGRGIGRSLMEGIEALVSERGGGRPTALALEVDTQNTAAVALYESMGFETRGLNGFLSGLSDVTSWSLLVEMEKKLD